MSGGEPDYGALGLTGWLVLALVLERESYGYEIANRYRERFGLFLPARIGSVYRSLDRLEHHGLVAQQPLRRRAKRGPRAQRADYEATRDGFLAHEAWLISPPRSQWRWRAELLARVATAGVLRVSELLELVELYERGVEAYAELVEQHAPPQTGEQESPARLLRRVVLHEQRMVLAAQARWASYARREIESLGDLSDAPDGLAR